MFKIFKRTVTIVAEKVEIQVLHTGDESLLVKILSENSGNTY